MSGKTRIVVLHMKEIIYTAIFAVLAALLIGLLVLMFGSGKREDKEVTSPAVESTAAGSHYVAGVYTTPIELNDESFDVQITVDHDQINAIELVNLSEETADMYPLLEPTMEHLASQIYASQSTDHITYDDDSKYTSMLLLEAIRSALQKAVTD